MNIDMGIVVVGPPQRALLKNRSEKYFLVQNEAGQGFEEMGTKKCGNYV